MTKFIEIHGLAGELKWVFKDIYSAELDSALNEPAALSVVCPVSAQILQLLPDVTRPNDIWVREGTDILFRGRVSRVDTKHDNALTVRIDALDYFAQTKDEFIYHYDAEVACSVHITDMLAQQVSTYPVVMGTIDPLVTRDITTESDYLYTALMSLRSSVGGYMLVDGLRLLDWATILGTSTGKQIRFRKNMSGITRTVDWTNFGNRVYAYGNAIELAHPHYLDDTDSITKYGICSRRFIDTQIVDVDTLTDFAEQKLAEISSPRVSYDVDLVSLFGVDAVAWADEELFLGSVYRLLDEKIDLDTEVMITRLVQDLVEEKNIKVELASNSLSILDIIPGSYFKG